MKSRNKCLIVTGGEYSPLFDDIPAFAAATDGADEYVIACDKGYENAELLGVRPDLIIGDFDSSKMPEDTDIPVKAYPVRKDDTDTMLAVKHAVSRGFGWIKIACALGGRFDHAYANIQAGIYVASCGGVAEICGKDTRLIIFGGASRDIMENGVATLHLPAKEGYSLSVFSMSDVARGVGIKNASYEADNIELFSKDPRGTSNAFTDRDAVISVREGILMTVVSKI